jgi:hypothetical protein
VGIHKWRSAQPSDVRLGSLILAVVVFGLLEVAYYFRNFMPGTADYMGTKDSLTHGLERALQVMAIGLGMGEAESLWPFTGPTVAALLLISAVLLIIAFWNQPPERSRALGLLLFVGFVACFAILMGRERSNCLLGYYSLYPALGLCCVYYVWGIYARSGVGTFAQTCLFALVCAIFPLNTTLGLACGPYYRQQAELVKQDLRAGAPPYKIVRYHWDRMYFDMGSTAPLIPLLRDLRDAGCGDFRHMGEDPPFREVPLSMTPISIEGATWDKGTVHVFGKDAYLVFPVPETKPVAGVRITYVHSAEPGLRPDNLTSYISFKLFWKRHDQTEFSPLQSYRNNWLFTGEQTETIWVGDTIDQLRIHPDDRPCDFKILKMVLIVPATE